MTEIPTTSATTLTVVSLDDQLKMADLARKNSEVEKDKYIIENEKEDIKIRKVYSLLAILESEEPDESKAFQNDHQSYKPLLSEDDKDIIKNKIFQLIDKY